MSKSEYVYNLLKKGLDASSLRSKVIANNIANINTQGYKRRYVTFEETLNNSINNINLKKTDERHISYGTEFGQAEIKQDSSTSMRQDGNNVDIDNEMVNQAANNLMYDSLVSQTNSRLSMTKYIIEGK